LFAAFEQWNNHSRGWSTSLPFASALVAAGTAIRRIRPQMNADQRPARRAALSVSNILKAWPALATAWISR
jgi:hypothetical protein